MSLPDRPGPRGLGHRPQHHHLRYGAIYHHLAATGFRLDYQADGVKVYRPGPGQ
jgi:hypothetical protein